MWAIKTFASKSEAKRAAARIVEEGVNAKVQFSILSERGCYALWDVVVKENVPANKKTGKPQISGGANFQWLNTAQVIDRNLRKNFEY